MTKDTARHPILRQSRWNNAKSPYAIVVNPWVSGEDAEAALLLRGSIVSAYAYIETRLAELAIRVSRMDAYCKLRDNYPHAVGSRLKFLRAVFARRPLVEYGHLAIPFLDRFERAADFRHFMAHARMDMISDSVGWGITFHDYRGAKDGITYRRHRIRLPDLEVAARRSVRLSRLAQRLLTCLDGSGHLPAVG